MAKVYRAKSEIVMNDPVLSAGDQQVRSRMDTSTKWCPIKLIFEKIYFIMPNLRLDWNN